MPGGTNYIRNSVKVVIDAYDGKVTFYQMDGSDSIANTWGKVYGGLFTPGDQMPADLSAHIRYPENLYTVQADVLAKYHMTDPQIFYSQEDAWQVPTKLLDGAEAPMVPYYEVLTLPGETEPESALLLPFTPKQHKQHDRSLGRPSRRRQVRPAAPGGLPQEQAGGRPRADRSQDQQRPRHILSKLTLWDQAGSSVIRGNLLVVPIGQSVVYFEPIYLQAEQANTIPELRQVIVAYGRQSGHERPPSPRRSPPSSERAPARPPRPLRPGPPLPRSRASTTPTDAASLIAQANQLYSGRARGAEGGRLGRIRTVDRAAGQRAAAVGGHAMRDDDPRLRRFGSEVDGSSWSSSAATGCRGRARPRSAPGPTSTTIRVKTR